MRQVFSSARLENVEGVAQLLRDAGIEVKITDARSFRTVGFRGSRSYTNTDAKRPAVWVVRSEDQPRARQMLRDAGLIDSTREPGTYALPTFHSQAGIDAPSPMKRHVSRIRMALIAGIVVAAMVTLMRGGVPRTDAPAESPEPPPQTVAARPLPLVVDGPALAAPFGVATPVPDAVVRAVLGSGLARDTYPAVCIAVDGRDASPAVLNAIATSARRVLRASNCVRSADPEVGSRVPDTGDEALMVEVTRFVPSGAERATVEFTGYHHREAARYKTFEVVRVDGAWRVSRTLRHVAS